MPFETKFIRRVIECVAFEKCTCMTLCVLILEIFIFFLGENQIIKKGSLIKSLRLIDSQRNMLLSTVWPGHNYHLRWHCIAFNFAYIIKVCLRVTWSLLSWTSFNSQVTFDNNWPTHDALFKFINSHADGMDIWC